MKIGDKKVVKKGNWTFSLERIKFDWKALLAWLIVLATVGWFIWFK